LRNVTTKGLRADGGETMEKLIPLGGIGVDANAGKNFITKGV
jgi:hypothetical protein